jgi:hypothetical protein
MHADGRRKEQDEAIAGLSGFAFIRVHRRASAAPMLFAPEEKN